MPPVDELDVDELLDEVELLDDMPLELVLDVLFDDELLEVDKLGPPVDEVLDVVDELVEPPLVDELLELLLAAKPDLLVLSPTTG
jgi:hypothetical protein